MVKRARKNNADEDVIPTIESIPGEKFRTTVDNLNRLEKRQEDLELQTEY